MPSAISAALLLATSLGFTGTALAVATYIGAAFIAAAPSDGAKVGQPARRA